MSKHEKLVLSFKLKDRIWRNLVTLSPTGPSFIKMAFQLFSMAWMSHDVLHQSVSSSKLFQRELVACWKVAKKTTGPYHSSGKDQMTSCYIHPLCNASNINLAFSFFQSKDMVKNSSLNNNIKKGGVFELHHVTTIIMTS